MSYPRFNNALWLRAIAVWLLIALAESVNGTLRVLVIAPAIGEALAHRLGFAIACALILFIAWLTAPWLKASTRGAQWLAGALWVVLMIAFEVGLGLAQGFTWPRILQEYNFLEGGLMAIGMLILLGAPVFGAWLRPRAQK